MNGEKIMTTTLKILLVSSFLPLFVIIYFLVKEVQEDLKSLDSISVQGIVCTNYLPEPISENKEPSKSEMQEVLELLK